MNWSSDPRARLDLKRAFIAGFLSLACLIGGVDQGGLDRRGNLRWLVVGLTVGFVVFGALAVRSVARELNHLAANRAGVPAAAALRTITLIIGMVVLVLGAIQLLEVNLRNILVGGAITGVIVGIAAQQPLGNFFAGLVLLFARPYVPGEYVRVRSSTLGGPFEGRIIYAGLMYTVMQTDEGRINIPNLGLMAAAIGSVPEPSPAEPGPAEPGPASRETG